ncbi:DUF6515 family protein [Sphingopyxis indica]|uniref:Uncharacterized protein n=1 Tax=Sphingopyxis indica TaxID=436663 RepID=A0A239DEZ3_9SPHN|nr:DUF6515 family protein [Sphingopyxis indica]SNS30642.1 hypothetical protein SAMN06295955_101223 [Sphingopyxis indica]
MILIVNGGLLAASLALAAPAVPTDLPRVAGDPATSVLALEADYLQRTRTTSSRSGTASRAKGSRPPARSGASANVNHSNVSRNRSVNNANVNRNVNRNANVNVNRNVDVNVHNDYHGGYYHDDWDDWDDDWHPVATIATAAVTAAVVGSIVNSVPPSCSTVVVNGISYSQCGNTWYQPQYVGSSVQYVVVNPPR